MKIKCSNSNCEEKAVVMVKSKSGGGKIFYCIECYDKKKKKEERNNKK